MANASDLARSTAMATNKCDVTNNSQEMILIYVTGVAAMRLSFDDRNSMEKTFSKIFLLKDFLSLSWDWSFALPRAFCKLEGCVIVKGSIELSTRGVRDR
jgi:hypothetical protein